MHVLIIAHLFCADVKKELDELSLTMKNFESRVSFAKDLETMSAVSTGVSKSFYILNQGVSVECCEAHSPLF